MNDFSSYTYNRSRFDADYDGDVFHIPPPAAKELELIGKVIIMEAGDKGPVFRRKGMCILFVNHSSKIVPGLVLVEDVVMKEKFGFIVGRNIEPKEVFGEDDFMSLISEGYVRFKTFIHPNAKEFTMMCKSQLFADNDIADKDNIVYTLYEGGGYANTDAFFNFQKKYFLYYNLFGGSILQTESIFKDVYFGFVDRNILEYFEGDSRFMITKLNITTLIGRPIEEIQAVLIKNANNNIDRLNAMTDAVKKIVKDLPKSSYTSIGKIVSSINEYITAINQEQ
jgi:hypothetical protein